MKFLFSATVIVLLMFSVAQAQATKDTVPGITNLARVETTVACAGAVTPSAVSEIKKMGFVSIINLRQPTEQGADIEGETAAAKTAGINFFNIPFNNAAPSTAVVDQMTGIVARARRPCTRNPLPANRPANSAASPKCSSMSAPDGWGARPLPGPDATK